MDKLIFSESFLDYIYKCDNKICRYLTHFLDFPNGVLAKVFTNKNINYITFRRDGTISFLPKGKVHVVSEENSDIWKKDNRQNGRSSATIRKIIDKKYLGLFKDVDFEEFANCYKQEFCAEGLKFELKSNRDIADVYAEKVAEGGSSLNSSCMQGRSDYVFDIYSYCKDLSILCLYNEENLLCGRALVWKVDGITIMDRIYVTQDYYEKMFQEYARKNDWWSKSIQSSSSKNQFLDNNGIYRERYFTIYTSTTFEEYPYIDTFTYGNDGTLTNNEENTIYSYDSDDEHRNGYDDDMIFDDINRIDIPQDESVVITAGYYRNCTTHNEDTVWLDGEYYWDQDDLITLIDDQYYLKSSEDICYCNYTSEWLLRDDCYLVDKGEYSDEYLPDDLCIHDIDGNIWYQDDSNLVQGSNGEYYEIGDERLLEIEEYA